MKTLSEIWKKKRGEEELVIKSIHPLTVQV